MPYNFLPIAYVQFSYTLSGKILTVDRFSVLVVVRFFFPSCLWDYYILWFGMRRMFYQLENLLLFYLCSVHTTLSVCFYGEKNKREYFFTLKRQECKSKREKGNYVFLCWRRANLSVKTHVNFLARNTVRWCVVSYYYDM